jgi:hypothetical protein
MAFTSSRCIRQREGVLPVGEADLVGGQNVETLVADEGGGAGDRVEGPLDLGPDALLGSAATRWRCRRLCSAGEVEEVGAFGVVELERPGQCLQHDVEQFRRGMEVELEHGVRGLLTNVTDDDPVVTGKIALAHLNEFPDYYTRLERLEEEAKREHGGAADAG